METLIDTVTCGDCLDLIPNLSDKSLRACITSPPYAEQRKGQYRGVPEADYPNWTAQWMEALRPKLTADGSALIVIRPHLHKGEISDYVLRTRLLLRERGWKECEELIWLKSDAPPLGSYNRPRRSYESILWFSRTTHPFVNLKACGNQDSNRVGGFVGSDRFGHGDTSPLSNGQTTLLTKGTSRCSDVFRAQVGSLPRGVQHPAMYPTSLSDQLVKTFSAVGDLVLDPFSGSGQTGISAVQLGRRFVGFDASAQYAELANGRLRNVTLKQAS